MNVKRYIKYIRVRNVQRRYTSCVNKKNAWFVKQLREAWLLKTRIGCHSRGISNLTHGGVQLFGLELLPNLPFRRGF